MSSPDPGHIILESRAACTALAASPVMRSAGTSFVVAGSQDGVVRIYRPPSTKIDRAINKLGDEIASIAILPFSQTGVKAGDGADVTALRFWIACGRETFLFDFGVDTIKLIFTAADARETITLLDAEDDILNQISLNGTATCLAFTSDSGVVGVVDLASPDRAKRLFDARHSTISNTVEFIPGWPNEAISGGFDCKVQHIDVDSGSLLGTKTFGAVPSVPATTSLSPPFVLCTAFSAAGCIAAGTADGRIYIGRKGVIGPDGKKLKRKGRWQGLTEVDIAEGSNFEVGVLDGPVVGLEWAHQRKPFLLVLSLSGNVRLLSLRPPPKQASATPKVDVLWQSQTTKIAKSNALISLAAPKNEDSKGGIWVAVGGVGTTGKGFTELMFLPQSVLAKMG